MLSAPPARPNSASPSISGWTIADANGDRNPWYASTSTNAPNNPNSGQHGRYFSNAAAANDYRKAVDEFLAAYAAIKHPATAFNIARGYEDLGELESALRILSWVTSLAYLTILTTWPAPRARCGGSSATSTARRPRS